MSTRREHKRFDEATLEAMGFPPGPAMQAAATAAQRQLDDGLSRKRVGRSLQALLRSPERYQADPVWSPVVEQLLALEAQGLSIGRDRAANRGDGGELALRSQPVPHQVWGRHLMDSGTLEQFDRACRLPVAVRGAQMPDGHIGYGLPIGGVLATRNAVIPYAVGVDIACRMRLTVYGDGLATLDEQRDGLRRALQRETCFGVGGGFRGERRRQHEVLDDPAWRQQQVLTELKDKAWAQLGSSGSGNHFVEFGELDAPQGIAELELAPGRYLALLSHSGSRGLGASIAAHFTKVAQSRCKLPGQAKHLAWLALDSADGQAYWQAMTLAGRYAAANHELIHQHVGRAAGLDVLGHVENHHNYAWLEEHDGEQVVVHRKGATPAGPGVLGVIPGSMALPGFVVRGKGNAASLHSAAHGAGRAMSRTAAKANLNRHFMNQVLEERGVELLAAGLDEAPQAYKDIHEVMAEQADLVEVVAAFQPRLVLMAQGGRAED